MVGLIRLLDFTQMPSVEIPYYSAIVVELRKDANNNHFVQVLFRNGTYGNPQPLTVVQINGLFCRYFLKFDFIINVFTGCEKLCPIDKYLQLTSSREIIDYKKECEFPPIDRPTPKSFFGNFLYFK